MAKMAGWQKPAGTNDPSMHTLGVYVESSQTNSMVWLGEAEPFGRGVIYNPLWFQVPDVQSKDKTVPIMIREI